MPCTGHHGRPIAPRRRPTLGQVALPIAVALWMAGCAAPRPSTGPASPRPATPATLPPAPASEVDGPGAVIPPDLMRVPDAEPRVELPREGGPNKPYEVLGQPYTPQRGDPPVVERGLASWYGRKFHGKPTASGERFDMHDLTAAHKTLPFGSRVLVRNLDNQKEIEVRINDHGPHARGRVIDLSRAAAAPGRTTRSRASW